MSIKAKLTQGGDGTAIPSGMVGEKITDSGFIQTLFTTSDTDLQKSGGTANTLTLTPGRWQITYGITIFYSTATTLNDQGTTTVRLTTSGGVDVGGTKRSIYARTEVSGRAAQAAVSVGATTVVDIASSTTYKLVGKRIDTVGIGTGGTSNFTNDNAEFYAIRIA